VAVDLRFRQCMCLRKGFLRVCRGYRCPVFLLIRLTGRRGMTTWDLGTVWDFVRGGTLDVST
jgi:hypothetical protein